MTQPIQTTNRRRRAGAGGGGHGRGEGARGGLHPLHEQGRDREEDQPDCQPAGVGPQAQCPGKIRDQSTNQPTKQASHPTASARTNTPTTSNQTNQNHHNKQPPPTNHQPYRTSSATRCAPSGTSTGMASPSWPSRCVRAGVWACLRVCRLFCFFFNGGGGGRYGRVVYYITSYNFI